MKQRTDEHKLLISMYGGGGGTLLKNEITHKSKRSVNEPIIAAPVPTMTFTPPEVIVDNNAIRQPMAEGRGMIQSAIGPHRHYRPP